MKEFIIQKNEENQRFDKYLKKLLPNAGSSFLYKMLRKKNIVINKQKATGNEKLKQGDVVSIFLSDDTFAKFSMNPELIKKEYEYLKSLNIKGLKVVFEDDEMILLNKSHNMLSQKSNPTDISANEYLLGHMIQNNRLSFEEYMTFHPSVVNRLDRNTTGLLIFGKTLKSLQTLGENIKNRSIQKFYIAVVAGELKEPLNLKGYLLKDEKENKVTFHEQEVEGADSIETGVKPIACQNGLTLVEIHLITGKTHQIRLHLSTIGHPILGDMKYGDEKVNKKYYESHKVNHQLLHAYRLEFPDGRKFKADVPGVFHKLFPEITF